MKARRIIFLEIAQDDMILACRAVNWLRERFTKDAILAYGEGEDQRHFYVKRNKSSITVRPC